jgi:hypothetical protein
MAPMSGRALPDDHGAKDLETLEQKAVDEDSAALERHDRARRIRARPRPDWCLVPFRETFYA